MSTACIRFLGMVGVEQAGVVKHGFESRKALALLGYLVSQGKPVTREYLIGLFWGEKTESLGRGNLSRVLNNLNQILPGLIHADRFTVEFIRSPEVWVDLDRFDHLTRQGDPPALAEALPLWRGDFMEGVYLDQCPEAEIWFITEREHWRQKYIYALLSLIDHHTRLGEFHLALDYCSRLLTLEPWREEVHRQRMELLARTGQRSAALKQWDLCRKMLADELNVEPSYETCQLYQQIRNSGERSGSRLPNPEQLPTFVGREKERTEVYRRLAVPGCRLLTITGQGGIGKSRLALEVAWQHRFSFLDGVAFVPIAAAHSSDQAAEAIAAALRFSFQGRGDLAGQLGAYFAEKEVLLVLDNFEHLLHQADLAPAQEARQLVITLLGQTKRLKILVTSRERLSLRDEWIFPLSGLEYDRGISKQQVAVPPPADVSPPAGLPPPADIPPPAVKLFSQRASRIQPGFSPTAEEGEFVAEICRLVEGNPLGIELAASLVSTLSASELASQIRLNLDALASPYPDIPERHKGLRSVFNQSWALLREPEQRYFESLAVFEGGFRVEACRAVIDKSSERLAGLASRSLIRIDTAGRCDMHQILRQYAREKLLAEPQIAREVQQRHSEYYLSLLAGLEPAFRGGQHLRAIEQLNPEIENIRQAWQHALEELRQPNIDSCLESLFQFYDLRGWLQEGQTVFAQAAERFAEQIAQPLSTSPQASTPGFRRTATRLRLRQAICLHRLGSHQAAKTILETCLVEFQELGDAAEEGLALYHLGFVSWWLGDYAQAESFVQKSCEIARQNGDAHALAQALNIMGLVSEACGRYLQAQAHHLESLGIFQQENNRLWIAKTLNYLGIIAYDLGLYDRGVAYYQEGLAIRRELDDPRGVALTLTNLGNTYHLQKAYAQAVECHQEALALFEHLGALSGVAASENNLGNVLRTMRQYRDAVGHLQRSLELKRKIGDRKGCANSLNNLAWIALEQNDFAAARQQFHEALQLAQEVGAAPVALETAQGVSALLAAENDLESAARILLYILGQPAAEEDTKTNAAASWDTLRQKLTEDEIERLAAEAQNFTLEQLFPYL